MMRPLPRGIYTPLPTFFNKNEDLDLEAFENHVRFIARAGTVPVISGTMGEAVHLDSHERKTLIEAARRALDDIGLHDMPIIAGVGAPSTRETIRFSKDAAAAGADFVMAIPPGYYASALLANTKSLQDFFVDVAAASPVPVIMYNFPGVSSGIDMDSDLVVDIVKAAPNICGIKLTCANVGKLTRIMAEITGSGFLEKYPRKHPDLSFTAIDGFIDFLLPSVSVGAGGAISGLPNVAPLACVKLWTLCQSLHDEEANREARELQNIISLADGVALKIGIAGMKKWLSCLFGYSPLPRRPLLPMEDEQIEAVLANAKVQKLLEVEKALRESASEA